MADDEASNSDELGGLSCSAGELAEYDGSNWVCADKETLGTNWWTKNADDIYYTATTPQVGIGTSSPSALLHIGPTDTTNEGAEIRWDGSQIAYETWVTDVFQDKFRIYKDTTSAGNTDQVQIFNPNGTGVAGLYVEGNIGIGTTNPVEALHVVGDIYAKGNGTEDLAFLEADDGSLELSRESDGAYIDLKNAIADDFDVRMHLVSDGFAIWTGGNGSASERMRIDSSGNVGIGISIPTSKLHVSGDVLLATSATCAADASNKGALKLNATSDRLEICDGAGNWGDLQAASSDLSSLSCNTDELIKWDGSAWVCTTLDGIDTEEIISQSLGGVIGDMTAGGGLAAGFDSNTSQAAAAAASTTGAAGVGYIGKDWGASLKRTIKSVIAHPATDQDNWGGGGLNNVTLHVYGSNTAPTGATDGTLLGSSGTVNTPSASDVTVSGLNTSTPYRYHWLTIDGDIAEYMYVGEVFFNQITSADSDTLVNLGCSTGEVAKYDGTAWICASVADADTLSGLSCASGQTATWDGANWVCGAAGLWTQGTGDDIYYNTGTPQVGIGTASPTEALDVTGTVRVDGMITLVGQAGDAPQTASSGLAGLSCASGQVAQYDGSDWVCAADADVIAGLSCSAGELAEYDGSNWVCADKETLGTNWWTKNADDIYYTATTPQVGIGTSSPVEALHVVGDIYAKGNGTEDLAFLEADDGSLELSRESDGAYIDLKNAIADDFDVRMHLVSDGFAIWTGGNGSASERMRIDSSGNVGIGTSSPERFVAYRPN